MISFVIPVKNDAASLKLCLASIAASDFQARSIEVVVADNGSTDDSASVARSLGAKVLTIPGVRLGELMIAQGQIERAREQFRSVAALDASGRYAGAAWRATHLL